MSYQPEVVDGHYAVNYLRDYLTGEYEVSAVIWSEATDADCRRVGSNESITALTIQSCSISDQGFRELTRLANLQILVIRQIDNVSDAAAAMIGEFRSLMEYSVYGWNRNSIIPALTQIETLQPCSISTVQLTDEELAPLLRC